MSYRTRYDRCPCCGGLFGHLCQGDAPEPPPDPAIERLFERLLARVAVTDSEGRAVLLDGSPLKVKLEVGV